MFHCSLVDRRGTTIITIPENALGIIYSVSAPEENK